MTCVRVLTVSCWVEKNAFDVDVQLRGVVAEHEVLANTDFPRRRVVRQKLRPHRSVTQFPIATIQQTVYWILAASKGWIKQTHRKIMHAENHITAND